MSVLIDLSNLRTGGGLQVAASFVDELAILVHTGDHAWPWLRDAALCLSPEVRDNCTQDLTSLNITVARGTPFRKLVGSIRSERYQVVFVLFGPDYARRRANRTAVGFADVVSLWPTTGQNGMGLAKRARGYIRRHISRALFRRAERLVVEAPHVRDALCVRWGFASSDISVVPNAINGVFRDRSASSRERAASTFIYPTRAYRHKNLDILGSAGRILSERDINVKFVLTLSDSEWLSLSPETRAHCTNYGPVRVSDLPQLYAESFGTVFPSLLESFSVTPLEALATSSVLVASDRPFVRDIAGDAAIYFDPDAPHSLANAIESALAEDPDKREVRIVKGRQIVNAWPLAADRARAYLTIIAEELEVSSRGQSSGRRRKR